MSWTKTSLIEKLREIKDRGWIPSGRSIRNVGAVGNTLEDLLGIKENNLPLANAGSWELKAQRKGTESLTTLFHLEPEPRRVGVVKNILLPKYGWPHKEIKGEMSFRVTMSGNRYTDRGFKIIVNKDERRLYVDFNAHYVSSVHNEWLKDVERRVGLGKIDPQPYWTFDTLEQKTKEKLRNAVYVLAMSKIDGNQEYFYYDEAWFLEGFRFDKFISAIEKGLILIDFDARTGHNHGTKFRVREAKDTWAMFYDSVKRVI